MHASCTVTSVRGRDTLMTGMVAEDSECPPGGSTRASPPSVSSLSVIPSLVSFWCLSVGGEGKREIIGEERQTTLVVEESNRFFGIHPRGEEEGKRMELFY